jgi:predicted TIM-barrel fold metal-dependent hydrolase
MPGVIDADTHIIEPPAMWDRFEKKLWDRRPVMLKAPSDTLYKSFNAFWLIDGNIFPKSAGKGSAPLSTPSASDNQSSRTDIDLVVRELTDPEARLRDLDKRGAEIEVIYSTLFGAYLTDDVDLDVALCRAYNRWMGDVWAKGHNRLRWTAVFPLTSIDESIQEMHYAKKHGAVGVYVRGVEGTRSLADPYFFPIYEEASHLDFPICVHTGAGSPAISSVFDVRISHTLPHSRMLPLMAFRDIVGNKIPELFPNIKFGFIESGASWVPYLLHQLKRSSKIDDGRWGPKLFRDYRLWVACEANEDLPMLLHYIDEDHLMIGSDYGHLDQSFEDNMARRMRAREDVPSRITEKILCESPRNFYPF